MQPATARFIYRVGAKRRNPSMAAEYHRLLESEWLSKSDLEAIQLTRAKEFLNFARKHSPYYRDIFDHCGFDPSRMSSLKDMGCIPTIEKKELVAHSERIRANVTFNRIFRAETSGTSGVALAFDRNEQWDSIVRAHVQRAYRWYGVNPWDRNGYLWGYNISPSKASKIRLLDSLQNRFRLFRYDKKAVQSFARKLQSARFLSGYSSMIYEVAKLVNELEIQVPNLRMVKGTSEMILPAYQYHAERAFGQRIVSEYGATEAGLIAFECPSGSMHINVEDVILEVSEEGEAVITNLASLSFPIVRYRLGDAVRLSSKLCECGRNHPVLAEVSGRRGGTVLGKQTKFPALSFYYVFKNLAVDFEILLNYRVVQNNVGKCTVYIEHRENRIHNQRIAGELAKYFSNEVEFEIEYVESMARGKGKTQYFESTLAQ